MRAVVIVFALGASVVIPGALLLLRPHWWLAGIGVLALAHALVLWPTIRPNVQWLGPVMTCFETSAKEVWLTIDDGPTADTPALLDALHARGVNATFFVKGALVAERPDLATMMLAHGHTVENHSQTHPSGSFWRLLPAELRWQVDECGAALERFTGVRPRLFRAPVGMKNPFVHPILARCGLTLVGWSVRGFDSFGDDVQRVVRRIVPRVNAGAIIVMHQGRGFSVDCVSSVVDTLQQAGYSFVIPSPDRLKTKR